MATVWHVHEQFQSALPLRGATYTNNSGEIKPIFQSALPLRGATRRCRGRNQPASAISIRAPLAGSDLRTSLRSIPTLISIRAPLAGSDLPLVATTHPHPYFNPRSPCGERPWFLVTSKMEPIFQSALPLRGATEHLLHHAAQLLISIRAPLAGSDWPAKPGQNVRNEISIRAPLAGSDISISTQPLG